MNAASCSVNSNPLAQFNKYAQDNNSHLQQGNMSQRNGGSSAASLHYPDQFKTTINTISESSKAHMNHFMSGSNSNMNILPSPSSSASLQLGNMNTRPTLVGHMSPQQTSFSTNHVPTLKTMQENHQMTSPSSTSLNTMRHEWSQEFQHHNQSNTSMNSSMFMNHQQQQPGNMHYQPLHHISSNYNIYGNSNSNFRPLQRQSSNRDVGMTTPTTNWDQQFNDLEKEVSKALNINDDDIKEEVETSVNDQSKSLEDQDIVIDNDYQAEFQHVWDSIHQDAEDIMPNYMSGQRFFDQRTELGNIKYDFEDSKNEYLNNPNAYEIGCILMENGAKLSEAAMAFEAAVKENPQHVDAWLKLGLVQIQNEKEINGISALENCLKLDPTNLEAMKNLAISYINEGYDSSSFTILNKWIETKYPQIDTTVPEVENLSESEMEDPLSLNEKITKRFLRLANQLPQVDPDVQLCLGLLFYANDDFDKTIDCFKSALKVNPNDELMWNRLGAALANSNRSEESIKAYHRALQLKPSFVRARYNLAVSSMNIGCYKEAVEHLLTSLRMHEVEGMKQMEKNNHSYDNYNNDNIIETLKRAFIAMDRTDLLQKVSPGMDLNQFRNEFKF
ncbi:peroxisomal targeting signal receptor [Monosporozyma unispora]